MRGLVCAALLAALVGCNSDKSTAPTTIVGSYSLHTVNGSAPPVSVAEGAIAKVELIAGTIDFNADQTWSGTLTLRRTDFPTGSATTSYVPANGAYAMNNGSITLTSVGTLFTGTASNGTVTLLSDVFGLGGLTLVFQQYAVD